MKLNLFIPLALALLASGCKSQDEEITETSASTVSFEGKPDARLAGHWSTADNHMAYDIKPDGTYESDAVFAIKGKGDTKTHSKGEWRENNGKVLFKDADGNVVPYAYELKGADLTFTSTGSLKAKTVLKKK